MNKKRSPPTQITQWIEKCRVRLTRSVKIKKASQDKRENRTTITTNISYIQNFMNISKKNCQQGQNSVGEN